MSWLKEGDGAPQQTIDTQSKDTDTDATNTTTPSVHTDANAASDDTNQTHRASGASTGVCVRVCACVPLVCVDHGEVRNIVWCGVVDGNVCVRCGVVQCGTVLLVVCGVGVCNIH